MPTRYVIDASALGKALVEEPDSERFVAWLAHVQAERARLLAPSLLTYELAAIICRHHPEDAIQEEPDYVGQLVRDAVTGIELDEDAWFRTGNHCTSLTAYDASYLALARAKDATLVTYDKRLARRADGEVPVIGINGLA